MAQYEYDVITWVNKEDTELKELCNQKGQEGWELFQVISPKLKDYQCIFRRRK